MSDENIAGNAKPPVVPAASGTFDWLRESHQQSVPLAPLSDDIPSPAPAPHPADASSAAPYPDVQPPRSAAFSDLVAAWTPAQTPTPVPVPAQAPEPVVAISAPPPAAPVAAAPPLVVPRPSFMSAPPTEGQVPSGPVPAPSVAFVAPASEPAVVANPPARPVAPQAAPAAADVFSFAGLTPGSGGSANPPVAPGVFEVGGAGGLRLERHRPARSSGNGPLDWIAFVLSFLAPPVGLLLGLVAIVVDSRTKGFISGIAKAAVAIAIVLSIGLTVGLAVFTKLSNDQAAHDAIVASSRAYCASLKSNPATLASDTYAWPAPANTIPDSLTTMKAYEKYWAGLVKLAPHGIKGGTTQIESAAKSIITSVNSTQTLDDSSDVSEMQAAVANSGVQAWVSEYCK